MDLENCIKEFMRVQYTRTSISSEFHDAMEDFFVDKINEQQLQQVIKISTDGLVECSKEESEIEKKLRETHSKRDLGDLVKTITEQEKAKMADTIERYQAFIKSDPEREEGSDETYRKKLDDRTQKIDNAMEELRSELANIVASNPE